VDKYQGEENKIVLLSLVRSNGVQDEKIPKVKRNPLGFLSAANRAVFFFSFFRCCVIADHLLSDFCVSVSLSAVPKKE
jgi:hypothetical protein